MALDAHPLNSLGFAKPPAETRVVVAMSGGVDSSVVAAQLAEEGYDVVGVTLQLYDHGAAMAKKGACCAGLDIHAARRVAEEMGYPHYVLDYENTFKEAVIDEFADSYLAGATPVPWRRATTFSAKSALQGRSSIAQPMQTAIKAISYSRPHLSSSHICASHRGICPPRMTPARWLRATGWPWLTSRTAKTSALCQTATMQA